VPCRVGSSKAHQILTDLLAAGGGPAGVDSQVAGLEAVMRRTSICGLGQVALGPVMSVTRLAGNGNGAGGARESKRSRDGA
jgi:NADH:ubiquinone oxidoreductase subunit F (NADH-binding)